MISNVSSNYVPVSRGSVQQAPSQAGQGTQATMSMPSESVSLGSSQPSELGLMSAMTTAQASALEDKLEAHVPGQVIVKTKPQLMKSSQSVAERFGAKVLSDLGASGPQASIQGDSGKMLQLQLPEGMSTAQALALMADDPSVEYVVPNHIYQMEEPIEGSAAGGETGKAGEGQKMPNDLKSELWGMNNNGQNGGTVNADIDAPEAWNHTTGLPNGSGPVIAIIDTGADINHPDLVNNIWTNPGEIAGDGIDNDGNGVIDDVHGYNAFYNNGDVSDHSSHGTHVAGTIAAEGNNGQGVVGVNWQATIMPVRIFNDQGSTDAASIIRGINYASTMGARLTSNSWGGGGANEAIKEAFQQSSALHIMSAGNSGTNNDVHPHYPSDYEMDNNICVAATDRNDQLANFSCYGEKNVDIAAPGVDILSTVPGGGYKSYSGTSMATPHVTGAAGLLLAQDPTMSNDEIKARLLGGAEKIPSLAGKVATGARLNVNNALTMEYNQAGTHKA